MRDYIGDIPPSPKCELPEPVRPESEGSIMVTETCPHCNVLFLLVNCSKEMSPTGERWLEAEPYWEDCRQYEDRHARFYTSYGEYPEPRSTFEDYGVSGFDFKNWTINPEETER